jgi:hypothetical protein
MTTYYVDGAVGNDANAGTSEGAGNAWATIDKAMNTVTTADVVYVKATGTYVESPVIDTASASANTPIHFEGYTTTTGDNGKVTIASTGTNSLTGTVGGNCFYIFKNFIFDGTNASSNVVSLLSEDYIAFYNCEFKNSVGAGITADNFFTFVNCEFSNNANVGCTVDNNAIVFGCIFANNGGDGLDVATCDIAYRNVFYGMTGTSNAINGQVAGFIGNTIDGENVATKGVDLGVLSECCVDNIIYDCATAVTTTTTALAWRFPVMYNLLNSNTTDYSTSTLDMIGYQDVTSAPAFADEANDDYRPSSSSPAVDAQLKPGGIT